jgi:hypothetical protein
LELPWDLELGFTGNVCCYDPRLYALNVFAEQFSHSVQPLVPARLFISHAAGKDGQGQIGGGNVLETLLSLILSEKAGINMGESASNRWKSSSRNLLRTTEIGRKRRPLLH